MIKVEFAILVLINARVVKIILPVVMSVLKIEYKAHHVSAQLPLMMMAPLLNAKLAM